MKRIFYLLLAAALFTLSAHAQQFQKLQLKPVQGQKAIKKKITDVQAHSLRKAQDTAMRSPNKYKIEFRKLRKFNPHGADKALSNNPNAATRTRAKVDGGDSTDKADTTDDEREKPNVWSNFLASSFEEYPVLTPPDPNGAVSSSQVVVVTNASIKVFEKRSVTEAPLTTPRKTSREHAPEQLFLFLDDFFSVVLPPGSYSADPHIRFDRLTKRWFLSAIEVNASSEGNYIMLAVSDGERFDSSSSFLFYRFRASSVFPGNGDSTATSIQFFDFPRLGVDRNAVLIGGVNQIANGASLDSINFVGFILDKKSLIRGDFLIYGIKLGSIDYITGNTSGMYVPQAVYNDDPAATKSFFAGINFTQDGLVLTAIDYNQAGEPTGLANSLVPVAQFNFPRDVTALGSPMPIDPQDTRLLVAAIHKNKLTGASSLWTAHAIGVNSAGNYVAGDVFVDEARTASRWYEVGNIYDQPTLTQFGTVFDNRPSGRRATYYFNPSVATNGQGYTVMGGTTSAFNKHLNVFVADRYYEDAPGTMNDPFRPTRTKALFALVYGNYIGRWGDYSQTVVDPDDDQTIWTFQEYANVDDSYGTRAVQLKAPPPATPLPLGMLSNRRDTVLTIRGMSIDHSAFFDPGNDRGGPGYRRLTVKSSGGILVSIVRFISPTEIQVRINTRNKPAGTYTLVITNPDGQIVTTNYQITDQAMPGLQANEELKKLIESIKVFPNPTPGEFKLQFESPVAFTGRAVILDVSGKVMLDKTFSLVKGYNEAVMSLAGFTNGAYVVAVYDTNNVLVATHVVIKQ